MPREIDERKKRKALRKLRRAADLAERGEGPPLSDWETEFLEEVEARIETYGSAFADPEKGSLDDPMSALQARKLKEIDKKARGKGTGLKTRKPLGTKNKPAYTPRVRQLDDENEAPPAPAPLSPSPSPSPSPSAKPTIGIVRASDLPALPKEQAPSTPKRPHLRLVKNTPDEE